MRRPHQPLYLTFGVACLLAGCGPVTTNSAAPAASASAAAVDHCQKFLTVTTDNDPHFQLEERFRITGPSRDGDYRLRPVGPGHQAMLKDHPVVKASTAGDKFDGEIEVKGGPHSQPNLHYYEIDMELDSNGCPSRLSLETDVHPGDPGFPDHGGDVVMN